ncbi:MAG: DUF2231 domain-containing protein [Rubricoccaceae bacterium]
MPDLSLLRDYTIPYLHPLAVHFPLVLLPLAAGAALVFAVRGTDVWLRAATILLGLGAAAALWARQTGEVLEEAVEGEPMAALFLEAHERGANATLAAAALALVLAALVWQRARARGAVPLGLRVAVLAGAVLAALAVAYTGHLGGLMVWGVPR